MELQSPQVEGDHLSRQPVHHNHGKARRLTAAALRQDGQQGKDASDGHHGPRAGRGPRGADHVTDFGPAKMRYDAPLGEDS